MAIKVSLTWHELGWLWYREEGYLSMGIGPLYIQLDWSK